MALTSFNLYYSYRDGLEVLTDAEAGRLIKGALLYAETGTDPAFTGNERYIWAIVKSRIDRDKAAYITKCEKNRANVSARYDGTDTAAEVTNVNERIRTYSNATNTIQSKANQSKANQIKAKQKSNKEEAQSAGRFSPPSVDDIRAYCTERKNGVDPEAFYNFYAAKGWKIGKNAMKDWRACVRSWEKRIEGEKAPENARGGLLFEALERRRTANE